MCCITVSFGPLLYENVVAMLLRGCKGVLNHLAYLFAFVLERRSHPGLILIYCSPLMGWSLHSL